MCRLRRRLARRVRFRRRRGRWVFRGFRGAWGGRRLQGGPGRRFLRKQVRLRSHQLFHALPTPSLLHAPASSTGRLVGAARDEHDCQRQAHGCPLVLTRPAPSLHAADARRWRREMPFATALSNLSRCWSHRFVSHHVGCRWRPRFRAVVVCALPIRVGGVLRDAPLRPSVISLASF